MTGDHIIIAGRNYGQGSSREHAALAPRYLGLRAVIAKSFARIHEQNLVNFGILPLSFEHPEDYDQIEADDHLELAGLDHLNRKEMLSLRIVGRDVTLPVRHQLSSRQIEIIREGSLMNWASRRSSER